MSGRWAWASKAAGRKPGGTGCAPANAAADLAGDADALLWRRDRHAAGCNAPDWVRDPFEKNVPGIGDRKGEAIVETLDLRGNESATVDRASNRLP
jgi:hypothetical protein